MGQFLTPGLVAKGHTVVFTYNSHKPSEEETAILGGATAVKADLQTGEGLGDSLGYTGGVLVRSTARAFLNFFSFVFLSTPET